MKFKYIGNGIYATFKKHKLVLMEGSSLKKTDLVYLNRKAYLILQDFIISEGKEMKKWK